MEFAFPKIILCYSKKDELSKNQDAMKELEDIGKEL